MPLVIFSRELKNHALLGVWQASEPMDLLEKLAGLTPTDQLKLSSIRLERRKREWLASRILLKLMARGGELSFLPNGKPLLNNGKHISISHSDDLVGLIISDLPIGIDIQGEDPKLLHIEPKFTHETERAFLPTDPSRLASLALIWSAKEAVFKCFGELVDFSEDMQVRPFQPGDSVLSLDYQGEHGKGEFMLEHCRFGEINIVTATNMNLVPHPL